MKDRIDTAALRELADEVDRLRAVIENAPHEHNCYAAVVSFADCICWKADAL